MSASGGANSVYKSDMPRTRPSSLKDVEAGCIEHPLMVFELISLELQSGIEDPLEVVEPGLILVIVSLQKEGSISAPPSRRHHVDHTDLLALEAECF